MDKECWNADRSVRWEHLYCGCICRTEYERPDAQGKRTYTWTRDKSCGWKHSHVFPGGHVEGESTRKAPEQENDDV